jgi:hypothetical protein
VLHRESNLVILSMAWLTREDARSFSRTRREPDLETLSYWVSRLEPLIRAEGEDEIIVVLANRCGSEGSATYAGTSAVLGVQNGEVRVYGILGRGERELLVVDTSKRPAAHLISDPHGKAADSQSVNDDISEDLSDARNSVSSALTDNSDDSMATLESRLSISTAPTSANPDAMVSPLNEGCCLTPTSPDGKFPQSYFGSMASPTTPEVLRPDNYQQSFTPAPKPKDADRSKSPQSRSAKQSPGHGRDESILLGFDFEPVPKPSPREPQDEDSRPAVHALQTDFVTDAEDHAFSPAGTWIEEGNAELLPQETEHTFNRTAFAASAAPARQEYSFMRNELGPRERHVSPRPTSTIW